jgi:hypothetical protein
MALVMALASAVALSAAEADAVVSAGTRSAAARREGPEGPGWSAGGLPPSPVSGRRAVDRRTGRVTACRAQHAGPCQETTIVDVVARATSEIPQALGGWPERSWPVCRASCRTRTFGGPVTHPGGAPRATLESGRVGTANDPLVDIRGGACTESDVNSRPGRPRASPHADRASPGHGPAAGRV